MKKLFALTLLAIIFLQNSTLAGCKDNLRTVVSYSELNDYLLLKTKNITRNKKIILKDFIFSISDKDKKKYSLNITLQPNEEYIRGFYPEFTAKYLKKKSSHTLYCKYDTSINKDEKKMIIITIVLALLILFFVYLNRTHRKKGIIEYNKTHKNKIKTYAELEKIREEEEIIRLHKQWDKEKKEELREDAEIKKRVKEQEKKRLQEEKKEEKKPLQEEKRLPREERKIEKKESSSDLGASLKRLKKMYNDGHLSKVEFEKAKNKLLK